MGLFDRLTRKENRTQGEVAFDDALLQAILGTAEVSRETALQIPTVSGGINLIANIVSGTPIRLYRDNGGKAEEIRDDYRLPLLNDDTGDTLNANEFWHALIRDYYLGKGGFAYIAKSRGKVKSLHYVDEAYISVNKSPDPIFKQFEYLVNGQSYQPWDFIRILRSTKDGATGTPITVENSRLIAVSYQQLQLEYSMAKRGGNKKGFLKSDKPLAEPLLTALKEAWKNLYANEKENVIVLNSGVEFQECSDTSAEMQLDENKRTNAGEFAKIFHVSPDAISGRSEDINSLAKLAAIPLMKSIECALNRDLLLEREKKDYYFAYDTKELLKGEMRERFEAYKTALEANFMQIDEVRYAEDLEPLGLTWIKLGLQDVLYDPKTKQIYTPNTNQTSAVGTTASGVKVFLDSKEASNPDSSKFLAKTGENSSENSLKSDENCDKMESRSEENDYIQDPKTGKMNGSRPSGKSKKENTEKADAKKGKDEGDRSDIIPNANKAAVSDSKLYDYLLSPKQKHYQDFLDAGYTKDNAEALRTDILNGVKNNKGKKGRVYPDGTQSYVVLVPLGEKQFTFLTAWKYTSEDSDPSFVSAYRYTPKE